MISGADNKRLLFTILEKADLALFDEQGSPLAGRSRLTNTLITELKNDPSLVDESVSKGLRVNSGNLALILSVVCPKYLVTKLTRFKADDFRAVFKDQQHKGINALWLLSLTVDADSVEVLITLLNHFKDDFTAQDFTTPLQDGPHSGYSPLLMLAIAAVDSKTHGLMTVLNHFKSQFTMADFTVGARGDGHNVLWYLSLAASRGKSQPLMNVLAHVAFDLKTLNSISNEKLSHNTQKLLQARRDFISLSETDNDHRLFLYAEAAYLAGYVEAYYELGLYFEKMNMPIQAARSFLKLADDSYYLENICNEYSAKYIGKATESISDLQKLSHLDTALKFALKINSDERRYATLQTIARIYINYKLRNGSDVGQAAIPSHLLEVMHGELDSTWCFRSFDEIAEKEKLKHDLTEKDDMILKLKGELQRLKIERDKENDTYKDVLIPIKELLTSFVGHKVAKNENQEYPKADSSLQNKLKQEYHFQKYARRD